MTEQEKRDKMVGFITNALLSTSFTFEFKVVDKPEGIKIVYEVTKEQMDAAMRMKGGEE